MMDSRGLHFEKEWLGYKNPESNFEKSDLV